MITIVNAAGTWHYPYHAFKLYHKDDLYIGDCVFRPLKSKSDILQMLQVASRGVQITIEVHLFESRPKGL